MSEEQKQAILERRAENRKLSERVQQGTRYHEPVKVKTIDGNEYEVEVYALSEDEFLELFEAAGVDPRDIGKPDKLVQNLKFSRSVAAKATRDENIGSVLMPTTSAEIMLKVFEISSLRPARVESFQQGNIQP
jgi:hypothetical protein